MRGKNIKTGHRASRKAAGFETHRRGTAGAGKRPENVWRFYSLLGLPAETARPHWRTVARLFALPGKHVRSVEEPVREAHCKDV